MSTPLWVGVLRQLRKRRKHGASETSLTRALGITPTGLGRELLILEQRGYEITRDVRGRVTLGVEGPLCVQELQGAVRGHLVCRSVQVVESVSSTQDVARKEAGRTDVGGVVVFAEHQTKGRGRFGREWTSPAGKNLLFSVMLRLPHAQPSSSLVTVTASVAVCECLFAGMNLPAQIRWPNDILLADRKVAGILVERTSPRGRPAAYLVGIGMNVNEAPTGLANATSIRELAGLPVDRTELALEMLRRLEGWYQRLDEGDEEEIAEHWRRHSSTLGRRITLSSKGKTFTGRVLHISPSEGLTIQMDDSLPMTFRPEQTTLVV